MVGTGGELEARRCLDGLLLVSDELDVTVTVFVMSSRGRRMMEEKWREGRGQTNEGILNANANEMLTSHAESELKRRHNSVLSTLRACCAFDSSRPSSPRHASAGLDHRSLSSQASKQTRVKWAARVCLQASFLLSYGDPAETGLCRKSIWSLT